MGRPVFRHAFCLAILSVSVGAVSPRAVHAQSAVARPWLGLAMEKDPQGVRVGHVVRGSPAEAAAVHEGDRLLRVAGRTIAAPSDVVQAVATFAVGDRVALEIGRGQARQTVQAVLAPFPSQTEMARMDLIGAPAPAFKDTQGVAGAFPASLSALRGHVVALDFWATWCTPCRITLPKLDALQARYGAQGLDVVGITTEDAADVGAFAQRMALHYAIGADSHGTTTRAYGVASLPTLVLIDKRGVVREVSVGYDPTGEARLETSIQSLLAEAAPAP